MTTLSFPAALRLYEAAAHSGSPSKRLVAARHLRAALLNDPNWTLGAPHEALLREVKSLALYIASLQWGVAVRVLNGDAIEASQPAGAS